MLHPRTRLWLPLFVFLASGGLSAREPGFFLMPEAPGGELVKFLSSPLLDRSVLAGLAERAEASVRRTLAQQQAGVLSEICAAAEPERTALRQANLEALRNDHASYRMRLQAVEDHTMRRLDTEIEAALREQAAQLRRIAFEMQRERQMLVQRSWEMLLASEECTERPLFPEKLMMPYYLSLFHYQSIFPPERRFASLLLLKDGR